MLEFTTGSRGGEWRGIDICVPALPASNPFPGLTYERSRFTQELGCAFPVFSPVFPDPSIPGPVDLAEPGIALEHCFIAREEIPIERIERTGVLTGFLAHLVPAGAAIVRHLVDVVAARGIGLGCQQSAIGELAHAECVG